MSTVQGLRFYYDGQFEGRRVRLPVQLGVDAEEQPDPALSALYGRLLPVVDAPIFHDGRWTLCEVQALDDSSANLAAWRWTAGADLRIVIVNLGSATAQGRVPVADALPVGESLAFDDLLDGKRHVRARSDLARDGLYVRLSAGGAHIFAVAVAPPGGRQP